MSNSKGIFASLADSWPSSFVSRGEVGKFSGGLLHPRSMANLDSLGRGPEGKVSIGRKIAYPIESLIQWMEKRAIETAEKRGEKKI